jgi:hypothetical protein
MAFETAPPPNLQKGENGRREQNKHKLYVLSLKQHRQACWVAPDIVELEYGYRAVKLCKNRYDGGEFYRARSVFPDPDVVRVISYLHNHLHEDPCRGSKF